MVEKMDANGLGLAIIMVEDMKRVHVVGPTNELSKGYAKALDDVLKNMKYIETQVKHIKLEAKSVFQSVEN